MPNYPQQGSPEQIAANRMSNFELGVAIDNLNVQGRYTAAEKKAIIREAGIRLRWPDNYEAHKA